MVFTSIKLLAVAILLAIIVAHNNTHLLEFVHNRIPGRATRLATVSTDASSDTSGQVLQLVEEKDSIQVASLLENIAENNRVIKELGEFLHEYVGHIDASAYWNALKEDGHDEGL